MIGDVAPAAVRTSAEACVGAVVEECRRLLHHGRKHASVRLRRAELALTPAPAVLDADAALDDLPSAPHVLFLCNGNICRSPMAERYFRARLEELGVEQVTVDSAGFIDREDRPSPDHAVDVAEEFDVDLTPHRSSVVTGDDLAGADLVVLMDTLNYVLLRRRFPGHGGNAVFLGAFLATGGGYEIPDPYGTDPDEFRRVFDAVAGAADELAGRMAEVVE